MKLFVVTMKAGIGTPQTPTWQSTMASPNEIWLVDFGLPSSGEPAHHRPALVVGPASAFGPNFPFAIVIPMATARRELALHVEIEATPSNGLVETPTSVERVVKTLLGH